MNFLITSIGILMSAPRNEIKSEQEVAWNALMHVRAP